MSMDVKKQTILLCISPKTFTAKTDGIPKKQNPIRFLANLSDYHVLVYVMIDHFTLFSTSPNCT